MTVDHITHIIDYAHEALMGNWRILLYEMPFQYSVRRFGLAVECDHDFFVRLGIPKRFVDLGGDIRLIGISTSPPGWCLYRVKPRNRKQLKRLIELMEARYPVHVERTEEYWKWLNSLPASGREKITRGEDFAPRQPIEWEEVKVIDGTIVRLLG